MLKELLQESVQEILEAQMSDLLNAESYERTEGRRATGPDTTGGTSTRVSG
jgi:transposase-like protein